MRRVVARDRDHLNELMDKAFEKHGDDCDLNHIDVSRVEDFSDLFRGDFPNFMGDISKWDVSNATTMQTMFSSTDFNGDLSQWNVGKVTDMTGMFENSQFDGDISNWDVSSVVDMERMFDNAQFTGDISRWDVSQVYSMHNMFLSTSWNGDISKWNVSRVRYMQFMFAGSSFQGDLSAWDVSSVENMNGMFENAEFQGDISRWNTAALRRAEGMFANNVQGLQGQGMSPWVIELLLEHDVLPQDSYWRALFQELLPMAKTLNLAIKGQAEMLWSKHTGAARRHAAGLPLPALD